MAELSGLTINDTGYLQLPGIIDSNANNVDSLGGVTITNKQNGYGLCAVRNGRELFIPTGSWGRYQNLPSFLIGTVGTTSINTSSENITLQFDRSCRVYMMRRTGWSAVSTSGWSTIDSDFDTASFITGYDSNTWAIYYRDYGTGSHNFDTNSAMYFVQIGEVGHIRYNEAHGVLEYYSSQQGEDRWWGTGQPFLTRQIITTNYTQGGYKSSAAWNNVNRTQNATDTTVNLGNGSIERSHNYQSGAGSKIHAYTFGAGNGHVVASNYIISYNMVTEQQQVLSQTLSDGNRVRFATMFNGTDLAYIVGGNSSTIREYNMVTQTQGSTYGTMGSSWMWAMSHEYSAIGYGDGTYDFVFATKTVSSRGGTAPGAHHQQKSINSKWGVSFAGNEGGYRGGYNLRRTQWASNTTSGTFSKPVGDSGEDNQGMGQDHQYMIGMYNGLQNNISWRFNYATESGFQAGSTLEPKGNAGMSSATNHWRE